ncbi:MAG: V-type ATPase subunit a family protein [Lysobacter sp.]|jgi:hypothetical protein|nr:V-type ATPase subunit a family protein [Lysobacter sp.]MDV5981130.1 V-type ATPase subunit a family protein [Lysobacter sp.]
MMFGRRAAKYWAIVGLLFGVGIWFALSVNVLVAMGFAGLSAACLLVAASCMLAPPVASHRDEAADRDPDDAPAGRRRNWRP